MIIKAQVKTDYVVIPNSLAQHRGISFELRGFLLYVLSKPETWVVTIKDLQNESGIGRDKAYNLINQGVDAGYIQKIKPRQSGKFKGVEYVVYPSVQPFPEKPDTAKPDTVNQEHRKERTIKRKESKKSTDTVSYDSNGFSNMVDILDLDDFGMWWNAYPKHTGTAQAKKAYRAARKITDAATLLRGAEAYSVSTAGTDKQYIKAPANWLKEELWEDNKPDPRMTYILDGNEILMTAEEARDVPGAYLKR